MAQNTDNCSRKADLVLASEYLRLRLHCEQPPLIKDRRYHARMYQKCLVGRELVDWLIEHLEASNRNTAITCMRALQDLGLIHHGMEFYIDVHLRFNLVLVQICTNFRRTHETR